MRPKFMMVFLLSLNFALLASCQTKDALIKDLNTKLERGETTISAILSDSSLMSLHSLTPFRDVIKQHAKAEYITLNTTNEPGTRITVKGIVSGESGRAVADKLVYVYQTSSEGWYSDTAPHILKNEGDRRHARLFGYFKTASAGQFEFSTIKPKGYPRSDLPAHIHIEILLSSGRSFITELLFDDDPRLIAEIRTNAIRQHFLIVKNTGTKENPEYAYDIRVPD